MRTWTYLEAKDKIERDLDLAEESFIDDVEMLGYFNEAIDEVEADVHNLYEDYFKTKAALSLVSGTAEYAMPSDIFANKIRLVQYVNGPVKYPVGRIRLNQIAAVQDGDDFLYDIIHTSADDGVELVFYPTPAESGAFVTIWYIRNANRLTTDASKIDVPEAINFILQHVKVRCMEKETHPLLAKAVQDLERQRAQLKTTLSMMVPDEDAMIPGDFSFYEEMS